MRHIKMFAWLALAMGIAALPAAAQDGYWQRRDLRSDYARVDRMRADIARDRWRMNEDIRCGRGRAAAAEAADLARDQRALNGQLRDIHRDRRDLRRDYRY
jgi:hypothetical protein